MTLLEFLGYLGPTLLLIGVLVFVHELGHFIVAKLCNVKVERFSLGFGPAVVRYSFGETEYRISWLPLGGYVKMTGEGPDEELSEAERVRSFGGQSVPRRIGIAMAGPVMNLVLPILILAGVFMSGWPMPTALVGSVKPGSVADRAGFMLGDRIVAVSGSEVQWWAEVFERIEASTGQELRFVVERDGKRVEIELPAVTELGHPGLYQSVYAAVLAVPDPQTPAGRAGLRTGDRVVTLNGKPVPDLFYLQAALARGHGALELEVERNLGGKLGQIRATVPAQGASGSAEGLGVLPAISIREVTPAKPARRAGLEPGDVLLRVNGVVIRTSEDPAREINSHAGAPVTLVILRDGDELEYTIVPAEVREKVDGKRRSVWQIGIQLDYPRWPGETRDRVIANPFLALWQGTVMTSDIFSKVVVGVAMLVSGQVGVDNLAGPIGIGEMAGDFFQQEGWIPFLWLICVISVSLAILNLLPIPILDGGHIVFALAEGAKGAPISRRTREIAQTVGLLLIVLLMGFVFFNDIASRWSGIIGPFGGS